MNPQSDERKSALFAGLVMQQSNMALMFLGKTPHPETGKPIKDLESARIFIDQLEMLDEKTRGNLSDEESKLLTESLTGLRMAFVEAVNEGDKDSAPQSEQPAASPAASQPTETPSPADASTSDATQDNPKPQEQAPADADPEPESRKKFTKKY